MRFDPIKRVVLFGGSLTLVGLAKWLISKQIDLLVYISPRHAKEVLNKDKQTLSELLKKIKVKHVVTQDINKEKNFLSYITKETLGIGIGEAWSFNQKIINKFSGKLIDFMGIPLPRYRGGAHYTWMIMQRERKNGMRLQVINKDMVQGKFDSGKIIYSKDYLMKNQEILPSHFFNREVNEGINFIKNFLKDIKKKRNFKLKDINEESSMFFPRLNTFHHGLINWNWDGKEIESFINAFDSPYIGASTRFKGAKVHLKKAKLNNKKSSFHTFQSGIVIKNSTRGCIVVATTKGELNIKSVINEFGKDIKYSLLPGSRFITTHEDLDHALQYNAEYNSTGLKAEKLNNKIIREKISSKKIMLRPLKVSDYSEKYLKWLNDPNVNSYLETRFQKQDKNLIKNFLKKIEKSDDSVLFGIFLKKNNLHIGNIKIGPINWNHLSSDVSYFIGDKKFWGKGLATEAVKLVTNFAFRKLNLNKCTAGVYSSNIPSKKVLENAGYKMEAILKSHLRNKNDWQDHLLYGALQKEFLKN